APTDRCLQHPGRGGAGGDRRQVVVGNDLLTDRRSGDRGRGDAVDRRWGWVGAREAPRRAALRRRETQLLVWPGGIIPDVVGAREPDRISLDDLVDQSRPLRALVGERPPRLAEDLTAARAGVGLAVRAWGVAAGDLRAAWLRTL